MTQVNQLNQPQAVIAPRTTGLVLGYGGLGLATVLILALHVLGAGQVNPLNQVISDYVFVPSGGLVLGAAVLSFGIGGLGALLSLASVGMAEGRAMRINFALLLLGAFLTATFPTDRVGVESVSAFIHRYAAGLMFFCIPIAALMVAATLARQQRLGGYVRFLRGAVLGVTLLLTFFLSAHFAVMPQFSRNVLGLSERLLFIGELVLLSALVYLPVRYLKEAR